jgi:hypothetical protein
LYFNHEYVGDFFLYVEVNEGRTQYNTTEWCVCTQNNKSLCFHNHIRRRKQTKQTNKNVQKKRKHLFRVSRIRR